jgi:hypothetical protein
MTTYRCRKCPGIADANGRLKPVYHPGLWACPKEGGYDAGKVARYGARKEASRAAMRTPAPLAPPTATPSTGVPAPGAPAGSVLQKIELGTKVAETARRDTAQPQAEADWLLPAESSETFFGVLRNAARMLAHWLDDILEAKKTTEGEIKDAVFEMNSHDLAAARGGFGQRFATKVVKGLGAKTLAEGIATVDTMAFLVMFATMFLVMVGHFIKVAGESPRLKKMREKAKEIRDKRKERQDQSKLTDEEKLAATTVVGRPVPGG